MKRLIMVLALVGTLTLGVTLADGDNPDHPDTGSVAMEMFA